MKNSQLNISCIAHPESAKRMRHALSSFLEVLGIEGTTLDDVLTAIGEALANGIEHAYEGQPLGRIVLKADFDAESKLTVDVMDWGAYIERSERPGRGFGLKIIRSIADRVEIYKDQGTQIHMTFNI